MQPDEYYDTFSRLTERIQKAFLLSVDKVEKKVFDDLFFLIRDFETYGNGAIKPTTANIRKLIRLENKITGIFEASGYNGEAKKLAQSLVPIKSLADTYLSSIVAFQSSAEKYNLIVKEAATRTLDAVAGAGLEANVIKPISELIKSNVTTGGKLTDLTNQLRTRLLDSDGGAIAKYSRQITIDSLNSFNADYNSIVSEDLGLEFYYYSGGKKSSTRKYCRERAGKYFHQKEIEEDANDRWPGRHKNTNERTIFRYRGGYACQHFYLPLLESGVPKSVLKRAKDKGYV